MAIIVLPNFIGRKKELERFRRDFFFVKPPSYGHCNSLVGLNGIGKTWLIAELEQEFKANRPENTFYFAAKVMDNVSFFLFWTKLINRFAREITEEVLRKAAESSGCDNVEEVLEIYHFFCDNIAEVDTPGFGAQASVYLEPLFQYYTEMGIRLIITIDEFDVAEKAFTDGQFFQFLYDLSPKGGTPKNLSIITISRRRVSRIAHHMMDGSNFEDAYKPITLKGFNDQEIEEYFRTYEDLPCGTLNESTKKEILYLCGRSPGLLMGMRHEIEHWDEGPLDIGTIYAEHGAFIKSAFGFMSGRMAESMWNRAKTKSCMDAFIQLFIGPVVEEHFNEAKQALYHCGFVTQGTAASNIFTLSGAHEPLVGGYNDEVVYEPISPYFVEYVKYQIVVDKLDHLSKALIHAEKLVRKVIEKELRLLFSDAWEEEVNRYAQQKDAYLETLQVKVLRNDFSGSISKLNVISFNEYYRIISDHWQVFSKYFTMYPSKDDLRSAMSLLNESRNFSAHLNLEVYNEENRLKLQAACNIFISCLENDPQNAAAPATTAPAPAAVPPARPTRPAPTGATPTEAQIAALLGTTVTFSCQAIKPQNKNLRGVIKENGFPAGISNKALALFDLGRPARVNDELTAVVERWDYNAGMFNLKAPFKV